MRNVELPEGDEKSDIDNYQFVIEERKLETRLSKYVRRYHLAKKIIGEKDVGPMKRNRLRSETFLVSIHEPKTIKDALDNDK